MGRPRVSNRLAARQAGGDSSARRRLSRFQGLMRVLVTGASGYIGRRVVSRFAERAFEVHAVARRSFAAPKHVSIHAVDLLGDDPAAIVGSVRPELLLHFAWNATPGEYWTTAENRQWERATNAIARAFFDRGGRR